MRHLQVRRDVDDLMGALESKLESLDCREAPLYSALKFRLDSLADELGAAVEADISLALAGFPGPHPTGALTPGAPLTASTGSLSSPFAGSLHPNPNVNPHLHPQSPHPNPNAPHAGSPAHVCCERLCVLLAAEWDANRGLVHVNVGVRFFDVRSFALVTHTLVDTLLERAETTSKRIAGVLTSALTTHLTQVAPLYIVHRVYN